MFMRSTPPPPTPSPCFLARSIQPPYMLHLEAIAEVMQHPCLHFPTPLPLPFTPFLPA